MFEKSWKNAKDLLHALSISKKYMIAFPTFDSSAREWRKSVVMSFSHSMMPTGILRLDKWQASKGFHVDVEIQ